MAANLPVPYDAEFAAWQYYFEPQPAGFGQWLQNLMESPTGTVAAFRITPTEGFVHMGSRDDMFDALVDPVMGRPMYFDRQGQPITMRRWGELRETELEPDGCYGSTSYVRVGEDQVGDARISTVWLGIDHGWGFTRGDGDYRPIIFETMIFGGAHDNEMMRYSTEAEAIKGHGECVADLTAGMRPWWAYGGAEDDEWHMEGER